MSDILHKKTKNKSGILFDWIEDESKRKKNVAFNKEMNKHKYYTITLLHLGY